MILKNQLCRIEIAEDRTYTLNSADTCFYDVILNPGKYQRSDDYTALSISVDLRTNAHLRIALIGSRFCGDISDCAILDREFLTILRGDAITQIGITDGSILQHIKLDGIGCNFAIYKVEKGYILYGELEITMLDFEFHKKWSFSGKDIFASVSGKNPFELREKSIHLWDFEDREYEIDFDGKSVK